LVIFGMFVTVVTFGTPVAFWYTRDKVKKVKVKVSVFI